MAECNLRFSKASDGPGTYKLLELPPDLCKLIESAADASNAPSLVIKGDVNEDAVLCTVDKTYTLRSVVLSNSVCIVTPIAGSADDESQTDEDGVFIHDQLAEVLELVSSVPRLHRLNGLLRGREYDDESQEDSDQDMGSVDEAGRPTKRSRFTYEDARTTLQSSDAELDRGLKERRILILDGELRPLSPSYLSTILEVILTQLVAMSLPHDAAPVERLTAALQEQHEIKHPVSMQVMSWFGTLKEDTWAMDIDAVVKQVGLGILRNYTDEPIVHNDFMEKWSNAVGDTFESRVSLNLLSGNYLTSPPPLGHPPVPVLTYFPSSSLPIDPAARFTDLFLTRPRWKSEEISPFLMDIVVDTKERDRLLLKFARAITDTEGVWYTARVKYNK